MFVFKYKGKCLDYSNEVLPPSSFTQSSFLLCVDGRSKELNKASLLSDFE